MRAKLSGKLEEGKMLVPKPTMGGNENHNGSLFKMRNNNVFTFHLSDVP